MAFAFANRSLHFNVAFFLHIQYNLTCNENLWKLTLVGTMNNIGQFFGLFLSGLISDRFGRRVVLVWGLVFCGVCGIIRSFMPTYELFLLFEFLDAVFGAGVYICGFVLGKIRKKNSRRILQDYFQELNLWDPRTEFWPALWTIHVMQSARFSLRVLRGWLSLGSKLKLKK